MEKGKGERGLEKVPEHTGILVKVLETNSLIGYFNFNFFRFTSYECKTRNKKCLEFGCFAFDNALDFFNSAGFIKVSL